MLMRTRTLYHHDQSRVVTELRVAITRLSRTLVGKVRTGEDFEVFVLESVAYCREAKQLCCSAPTGVA